MDGERLTLTISETAKRLGISRGLAYQMAQENRIPVIRFGRRLVVPRKALDELLANPASDLRQAINTQNKQKGAG